MLKKIWEFEKKYAYLFSVLPIAILIVALHSLCKKLSVSDSICTSLLVPAGITLLHQMFCVFLYLYQVFIMEETR